VRRSVTQFGWGGLDEEVALQDIGIVHIANAWVCQSVSLAPDQRAVPSLHQTLHALVPDGSAIELHNSAVIRLYP
jgi:hypothetical protein